MSRIVPCLTWPFSSGCRNLWPCKRWGPRIERGTATICYQARAPSQLRASLSVGREKKLNAHQFSYLVLILIFHKLDELTVKKGEQILYFLRWTYPHYYIWRWMNSEVANFESLSVFYVIFIKLKQNLFFYKKYVIWFLRHATLTAKMSFHYYNTVWLYNKSKYVMNTLFGRSRRFIVTCFFLLEEFRHYLN